MNKRWIDAFVLLAFAALTVAFTWPLAAHFATHFPGWPSEAQDNPWNMWHFRYNITVLHQTPLWSEFQYWPYGANLLLHHYTLFNDALAFFLLPHFGLNATHNALYMLYFALSGFFLYLFLIDWGLPRLAAFAGGLYFAFSPVAGWHLHFGQGMEYVSLWLLPLYLWALGRCIRDGSLWAAVLAALALTLEFFFNYYYFLSCAMLIPFLWLVLEKPLTMGFARHRQPAWLRNILNAGCTVAGLLVIRSLWKGQIAFHGGGTARELIVYVAPYLAFWGFLGLRLWAAWRVELSWDLGAFRWKSLAPYAAVSACSAALNWPMVGTVITLMRTGDYGAPPKAWRGGGNPVDLAYNLLPASWNPAGQLVWKAVGADIGAAPALGLVATALALWLWKTRPQDKWLKAWAWGFALFFILMLGPWLKLFGAHLYLPLPFWFLHLLPVFSNFPNGIYFNSPATLFLGLLVAYAVAELGKKSRNLALAALAALCFECWHGSTSLYRWEADPIFTRLKERPYGAVLPVPVSGMFHLIVPYGYVGLEFYNNMMAQLVCEKPMVGGTLSRSSRKTYELYMADPHFTGLLSAQEDGKPGFLLRDRKAMERFFKDWRLRYVLANEAQLPGPLKEAMRRWPMREVDRSGALVLYETF